MAKGASDFVNDANLFPPGAKPNSYFLVSATWLVTVDSYYACSYVSPLPRNLRRDALSKWHFPTGSAPAEAKRVHLRLFGGRQRFR